MTSYLCTFVRLILGSSETRLQIGVGLGCVSSIKKKEFADFHMLQKNASGAWSCCYDLLCP